MAKATIKKTTSAKVTERAPKQPRMVSFRVEIKSGNAYFTPVNKRAKKLAHKAGVRTLVTKQHLKVFKGEGNFKFGVYTEVQGKEVLKSIKV